MRRSSVIVARMAAAFQGLSGGFADGRVSPQAQRSGVLSIPQTWVTWVRRHRLDLALALGLLLIAVVIRLPYLQLIPQLTDETGDVLWALDIYQSHHLPLTQNDAYNGPVLAYVLAAAFWLFGVRVAVPRLVMLILGSLTVVLTYALARALIPDRDETGLNQSRLAGLIAAGIVATAFVPVVINSHITWSNCSTPFFVTLGLWVLVVADRKNSGAWLGLAGVLLGVAVQTHPSALVILPGLVVWFVLDQRRRAWLRTPWPYLAVLLFLVAYGNIIWYNIKTGFGSVAAAQPRTYALTTDITPGQYVRQLLELLLATVRMVGSAYPKESQIAGWLNIPALLLSGGLLVAGLARGIRRSSGLALAVLGSTALFMPIFNKFYGPALMARYIAYLLPLLSVVLGGLLAGWLTTSELTSRRRGAVAVAALVLIAFPTLVVRDHYAAERAKGGTNAVILALADYLHDVQAVDGAPIELQRELRDLPLRAGGHVLKGLDYLLTLRGAQHDSHRLDELEQRLAAEPRAWLVLTYAGADRLGQRFDLLPVDFGLPPGSALPGRFRLYALGDVYVPRRFKPPTEIPLPTEAYLGSSIALLGGDVNSTTLHPGETLELTLYWQAVEPMEANYHVFTHLVDAERNMWAQHDGPPAYDRHPTSGWVPGEIVVDEHNLTLPADIPPGQYQIKVGMYELDTLSRLPVVDAEGQPMSGDQIFLPVNIEVQ